MTDASCISDADKKVPNGYAGNSYASLGPSGFSGFDCLPLTNNNLSEVTA